MERERTPAEVAGNKDADAPASGAPTPPPFRSHLLRFEPVQGQKPRRARGAPKARFIGVILVLLLSAGLLLVAASAVPIHQGASDVRIAAAAPKRPETLPIASLTAPSQSRLDAPDLTALFASFDSHGDGLGIDEAAAFYTWVEDHVSYRYDDELFNGSTQGLPVGDGRAGRDYQQTPQETWNERMGDCEDQAALELAFYRHHRVPAYLAYVNARHNQTYDHAVAIVWGGDTSETLQTLLGRVPHYELRGRPGVEDGFYFIVDNTYSSQFGEVSGGIGEHKFLIHDIKFLEELFVDAKLAPILP